METCNNIRLKSITIDFELAVKNVFYKYYPYAEVRYSTCPYYKILQ